MRTMSMDLRPFRPLPKEGVQPARWKHLFEVGSRFEPGHRMRVRVLVGDRWETARYNRETHRFWIRLASGQYFELADVPIQYWAQFPPKANPKPDCKPEHITRWVDPPIPAKEVRS